MPKKLKNVIQIAIFLGIGLVLIWLITKDLTAEQKEQIKTALRNAHYWLVIPAMIIGIASHWARAVRWKLLIKPLGYEPGTLNTFFAVMVGYLANLAVPRLGEVSRCGILARYEKIPADKLIGTMIAERAIDLICLVILLIATVLVQIDLIGQFFKTEVWHPLQQKFANAGSAQMLLYIGILVGVIILLYFFFRLFARSKAAITLRSLARGVLEGILSVGKMERKGWFIFYTLLIWTLYFSMLYCGFYTLDETKHLGFNAALAILGVGSIGMIVTQGGIGAYHALVTKTLILYNIHESTGFAFSWILWLAQTLLVMVVGLLSLVLLPVFNNNKQK
ncbi:lysylphosphatidylglycerol synthase transmembrane domain-containing protein [uncultured Chitinophaga sp.]|jgi:Predicted integral membrane protein|uniref:lysylphosphatidylglycerol synthase transmembrane domain-containing protein n=1 Tax=uncultured Chitinophaga sp. TaxID=339340 RepID=UPI0026376D21|nr:lysylphosphatidylglycerol synthase transmembrane domain-containing protein [uncultured Chitinophaga sp.]